MDPPTNDKIKLEELDRDDENQFSSSSSNIDPPLGNTIRIRQNNNNNKENDEERDKLLCKGKDESNNYPNDNNNEIKISNGERRKLNGLEQVVQAIYYCWSSVISEYRAVSMNNNNNNKSKQQHRLTQRSIKIIFGLTCIFAMVSQSIIWKHRSLYHHKDNEFEIARQQSFGFFTDISRADWIRYQKRVSTTSHHSTYAKSNKEEDSIQFINDPNAWYHYNWNPDFTCPHEVKVGSQTVFGDGPKCVCDPERIVTLASERSKENDGCLIYSIGINGKSLSFEEGMQTLLTDTYHATPSQLTSPEKEKEPFCEIHVFDPNEEWDSKLKFPEGVHYHPWGIKASAKSADTMSDNSNHHDSVRFQTLSQTVKQLGHEQRSIDILKVDCKLCEWDTYVDWFTAGLGNIHQILVELHGSPEHYVNKFFDDMRKQGYVIFHKEANTQFFGGMSQDYGFLKLHPDFF